MKTTKSIRKPTQKKYKETLVKPAKLTSFMLLTYFKLTSFRMKPTAFVEIILLYKLINKQPDQCKSTLPGFAVHLNT